MNIFFCNPFRSKEKDCWIKCGIEVYKNKNKTVVIATELPDNPSSSITNCCELVIERVSEYYELDLATLTWIEHYKAWKIAKGDPYDREEETWDLIVFNFDDRGKINNVDWQHQNKEFVDRAIEGLKKVTRPTRRQKLIAGEQIELSKCFDCQSYIMPIYCNKKAWQIIVNNSENNCWQAIVDRIIQVSLTSYRSKKFSLKLKEQNYEFFLKEEGIDIDNPDRCLTLMLVEK